MAGTDEVKVDSLTRADTLTAKLVEVFNARRQLDDAIDSMREWVSNRQPGEDFGVRLLDCTLWAQQVGWLCIQAQIIAKGQEK